MDSIVDLPVIVVKGRVSGYNLIVDRCPSCKRRHTHGYLTSEVHPTDLRGFAQRMPHCADFELRNFYQIIDFTCTESQYKARLQKEADRRLRRAG